MTDALAAWRAKLLAGEALPPEERLFKQYAADSIKAEGDGKTYTWTISTGAIDRDRDTIKVDGWHTDAFLKAGGPVLYAHDSRGLPVGKAPWVKAQGGALKARVEFAPAEVYPFADTVRRLVDFGALKSTSVGFRPLPGKAAWNDERSGIDFMEQELLEFSIVPVPSNPEALLDAKAAGIDLAPVKAWAEGVLDGLEPGLWVPKGAVLDSYRALSAPRAAGFDPEPFLAEFTKRGRTLSAANESRVREASSAAAAVSAALDEVLASMPMVPEEEPKAAPVLYVEPVPTIFVDPKEVRAAVRAAVSEAARGVVSHARGRLD